MSRDVNLENLQLKLKVQALAERLVEVSTEQENKVADLRVEVTMLTRKVQQLEEERDQLLNSQQPAETIEGEVVDD